MHRAITLYFNPRERTRLLHEAAEEPPRVSCPDLQHSSRGTLPQNMAVPPKQVFEIVLSYKYLLKIVMRGASFRIGYLFSF